MDSDKNIVDTTGHTATRRKAVLSVLGMAALLALAAALWWWQQGRWRVVTDDAYVNADITQVAAQVGGTVKRVVSDAGQRVQAGDLLVLLDDADAHIAVRLAEAQLAKAVRATRGLARSADAAGTAVSQRRAEQAAALAQLEAADAALLKTQSELLREQDLARKGFVSDQALLSYRTSLATAQAQRNAAVEALHAAGAVVSESASQAQAAAAPVAGVALADQPDVAIAAAALRQALLNLERTRILAPREGVAGPRVVQAGEHVATGAGVATIVPLGQAWVDANFKESELAKLQVGQVATLVADVYGSQVSYSGRVVGITPATGSALSLLPAQNATGNWIKVVQRVPVRIALDAAELAKHPLQVGLSMNVEVNLRPIGGAALAEQPALAAVADAAAAASDTVALRSADARVAAVIAANQGR